MVAAARHRSPRRWLRRGRSWAGRRSSRASRGPARDRACRGRRARARRPASASRASRARRTRRRPATARSSTGFRRRSSAAAVPLGAFAGLIPDDVRSDDTLELMRRSTDVLRARANGGGSCSGSTTRSCSTPSSAALVLHLTVTDSAFVVATVRSGEPCPDAIVSLWKDAGARRIELARLERRRGRRARRDRARRAGRAGGAALAGGAQPRQRALRARAGARRDGARARSSQIRGLWRLDGAPPVSPSLVELVIAPDGRARRARSGSRSSRSRSASRSSSARLAALVRRRGADRGGRRTGCSRWGADGDGPARASALRRGRSAPSSRCCAARAIAPARGGDAAAARAARARRRAAHRAAAARRGRPSSRPSCASRRRGRRTSPATPSWARSSPRSALRTALACRPRCCSPGRTPCASGGRRPRRCSRAARSRRPGRRGIDYLEQRAHVLLLGARPPRRRVGAARGRARLVAARRSGSCGSSRCARRRGSWRAPRARSRPLEQRLADPGLDAETRLMAERRLALAPLLHGPDGRGGARARAAVLPTCRCAATATRSRSGSGGCSAFETGEGWDDARDGDGGHPARRRSRERPRGGRPRRLQPRLRRASSAGRYRDADRWFAEAELHFERDDTFGTLIHVRALHVGVAVFAAAICDGTRRRGADAHALAGRAPRSTQAPYVARAEGWAARLRVGRRGGGAIPARTPRELDGADARLRGAAASTRRCARARRRGVEPRLGRGRALRRAARRAAYRAHAAALRGARRRRRCWTSPRTLEAIGRAALRARGGGRRGRDSSPRRPAGFRASRGRARARAPRAGAGRRAAGGRRPRRGRGRPHPP